MTNHFKQIFGLLAFAMLSLPLMGQVPARWSVQLETGLFPRLGIGAEYYFTPHIGVSVGLGGYLQQNRFQHEGEPTDGFQRKTILFAPIGLTGNWSIAPKSRILAGIGGAAQQITHLMRYDQSVNPGQEESY